MSDDEVRRLGHDEDAMSERDVQPDLFGGIV